MSTVMVDRPAGARRYVPLAVWAMLAAVTAYVVAFNPTDRIADPTGPCLWHAVFGVNGPSCGGTRMYWYLIHGNLLQAARHHLAALIGLVYGGYALAVWSTIWLTGRRLRLWVPSRRMVAVYVALFLLYSMVLRNLPWHPFTWFAIDNLT